jgi:predicted RNA-binding Zn ribbon-like protein
MASNEAPGELELVRKFANTIDVDEGTDELETASGLGRWLAENGLSAGATPSDDDRERAVELREALRSLIFANSGERLDPAALTTLNRLGDELHMRIRFDAQGGSDLAPAAGGVDSALGRILAIVHSAMAGGTWPRLKACREDTCQWAFYDLSRNRSGTWCSMAVCGNRTKARKYRHRHAGEAAGESAA